MKRLAIAAALLPSTVLASQIGYPVGANLTYGDVSIDHNIMSNVTNPGFGSVALKEDKNSYRVGILNGGVKVELGQLDDVINKADNISTNLTQTSSGFTVTQPTSGSVVISNGTNSATIDANTIINDSITSMSGFTGTTAEYQTELQKRIATGIETQVNAAVSTLAQSYINTIDTTITPVTTALNDNGYMKIGANVFVPLTPLVITHNALKGSISLTANYSAQGKINYISSYVKPAASINLSSVTFAGGDPSVAANWSVDQSTLSPQFSIDTDSAIVVRTAVTKEVGLGYSRKAWENDKGQLHVGGRLNYMQTGLAKSYTSLVGTQDNKKILNDQIDASLDTHSGFGIDIGAVWQAENYRLGATVNNINSPSFTYKNVSTCSNFSNYVDANNSANNVTSATLADCNVTETYKMDPQLKLEAVTSAWNEKVTLGLGYDVNAAKDPFGSEYQWLTLSAGANLGNWLAVRGGYRSNQGENGLSYVSGGVTILGVTIDGSRSTSSISADGKSVPRAFMINVGWNMNF